MQIKEPNKNTPSLGDGLDNYFKSNINGQLVIDNNMRLIKFSPGTVQLVNLTDSDIGKPLGDMSTKLQFEVAINDIKTVLAEGCSISREIETCDRKWCRVIAMPYTPLTNDVNNSAIITFTDITALKREQIELRNENENLMRINADLDHFINAASHDLLGPLGNIEVLISLLKRKVVDAEQNKLLSMIGLALKSSRTLIQDIAIISKIEDYMANMEMIDLEELLSDVELSLEDAIELSGAIIIRDMKDKNILFSKKILRGIIYNLIFNAIKFRRDEPPLVTICSSIREGQFFLSVQDNGKGISQPGMAKIFDMYGKFHRNVESEGIGLFLTKKLVNAANGNFVVESEPGTGSKFTIILEA